MDYRPGKPRTTTLHGPVVVYRQLRHGPGSIEARGRHGTVNSRLRQKQKV